MTWLIPALIATSSMAMLIAMIYFFLYFQEREKYLGLWGISWAVYSLRFLIHAGIVLTILPQWFVVLQQISSLLSVYIFIYGTYIFLKKDFSRFWLYGTVFCILWTVLSTIYSVSFFLSHLPVAFFIGFVFWWTGYSLINNQNIKGVGKHIGGWSLILWGIHKADYPFLRPVLWFAPWGYLIASILFLTSAIGILLVYYEKIRSNLFIEITERKQAEETFQAIVQSTVGNTGQEFFDNICIQLSNVFKSECVIVGELIDATTVNAVAMVLDGKFIRNYSYQLPGTPCEKVTTSGFCYYPKDIILLFPDDKELQDIDATGYVGTPLKNHKGKAIGVLCILSKKAMTLPKGAEDLMNIIAARTSSEIERMQEEREKDKLEGRLQQAQKMEAIGTLAGGIAHDFNNILGTILGYTDMAKEDAPPGTRFGEDLDKVLIAANRAKDLVKQILAFSRQTQIERLPIKIQPLIKEGLKMLRSSIPTTISITEDIDPKGAVILADPTQVHQILMNLCTNSYHAMEEVGGALSVSLKTTVLGSDKSGVLDVNPGEYVELTVSDTGAGIGPEVIDKIFDPYFTTKGIGKGTGLGLAIIHGILKNYGGTITVESQLGIGTTFYVYFPVLDTEDLQKIIEPESISIGTERILFVDDEELLAKMGKDMLERLGYQVTVRRNSLEALTTFQNNPNEFDIVITDQTMPDMTGSELARRLMQIRPDIPIILCTGYSNLIDEHSAKAIGIKEFALKPLTKEIVAKLIRKVLDG